MLRVHRIFRVKGFRGSGVCGVEGLGFIGFRV